VVVGGAAQQSADAIERVAGATAVAGLLALDTLWRASQIPDRGPNKVPPGMEDDECKRNVGSTALSLRLKRRV
jgi:hypothetical protein